VATKLDRASPLAERAYEAIKQMVVTNEMPPGHLLTESGLGGLLGISRSPVRAALARLQEEGFLETEPWKGPRVAPLDAKYVQNIYQVRTALETLCARLSATRIPDADVKRLADAVRDVAPAIRSGEARDLDALDRGMHALIIDNCDNELLRIMVSRLQDHLERVRNATGAALHMYRQIEFDELEQIVSAMANRDADGLAAALERHVENYAARMLELFENSDVGRAGAEAAARVT
jgi:DNA-binding GntR family transcriptional regulator